MSTMLNWALSIARYVFLAIGLVFVGLELLWYAARSYAVNATTAMHEVTRLDKTRTSGRINGAAVVAGGSVAGLATAVVCSKFFDRVVIVEPDSMTQSKRTRVAQAEQAHGIQAVSLHILRAIISNFDFRLAAFGGRILESNAKVQLGATNLEFEPGSVPETIFISRISLEHMLRAYVREIPNVQTIQGMVAGVMPDANGNRIEHVLVQLKGDNVSTAKLDTSMFVDCSGPSTIGLKLLEKTQGTGWGPYPKTSYDPKISYATAIIPIPDRLRQTLPIFSRGIDGYPSFEKLGYLKCVLPYPEQDDRMVCMVRSDYHSLMCGIGGWDLSPDTRPRSFGEYIQQVDSIWQNASNGASSKGDDNRTAIMESLHAIEAALTEDNIVPEFKFCKMGSCYKIDYSKAPRPSNFVAVGDSYLRVNPTFGQGISKALVDVVSLHGALLDTKLRLNSLPNTDKWSLPDTFSTDMITRQFPRVMHMWDSTKDSDYGRTSTDLVPGESSQLGEFGRNYWRGVVQVASKDKATASDIIKSMQLIAPPLDLLRPSLFIRAMWSVLRNA